MSKYFYIERAKAKRAQELNMRLLSNVIEDENRNEVLVPTSVRGLAKSHQIIRANNARGGSAESNMFRVAYLDRVGTRAEQQRDERRAKREERRARAIVNGAARLSLL